MIAKYIVCDVGDEQRASFSNAQLAWKELNTCEGFLGQLGGWDIVTGKATILGLWKDLSSFQHFMNLRHDRIARANRQKRTYLHCATTLSNQLGRISAYGNPSFESLDHIGFIRIADCIVYPDERTNFEKTQQNTWNPGMTACSGMLGGFWGKSIDEPLRYLVTSFWTNEKSHRLYEKHSLPLLKEKSSPGKCIQELKSYRIDVEKQWTVPRFGTSVRTSE